MIESLDGREVGRVPVHDVVNGLDVEGFLDFGIWGDEEVEEDCGGNEEV